jgi:sRNA-binding protein
MMADRSKYSAAYYQRNKAKIAEQRRQKRESQTPEERAASAKAKTEQMKRDHVRLTVWLPKPTRRRLDWLKENSNITIVGLVVEAVNTAYIHRYEEDRVINNG